MTFRNVTPESFTPGGLRYRTSMFGPEFTTPPHVHERAFLCVVVDGMSTQWAGGGERKRDRGRAYFYPRAEVHNERFGASGGTIFSMDIDDSGVSLPRVSCELADSTALLARRLCVAASCKHDDLSLDETAMSLLGVLGREYSGDRRWMPIAREYLREHFTGKLSLRDVASAAGVHPVHLSRAFPQCFGVTLGESVRALRIDYAARMLVATKRPIVEIALEAGFASQSHLTRHFRARMGVAPAAYRAAC